MNSANHMLNTALGEFVFTMECDGTSDTPSIEITEVTPTPRLPPGMSVERCQAIIARVRSRSTISAVRWSCACRAPIDGSPNTGEWLDAQEWESGGRLVLVGTEDSEALTSRLGFLNGNREENLMTYSADRMEIRLDNVPADFDLSLHYILAENPWPEPVDASAWFAVDIPHQQLLDLIKTA